jgi:hypothetical protein
MIQNQALFVSNDPKTLLINGFLKNKKFLPHQKNDVEGIW